METQVLTERNAHRVAVIQNIKHPEYGAKVFNYKEQKVGFRNYRHTFGHGHDCRCMQNSELQDWKVISWKYKVSLDEYWDLARQAYNWTSHDPEHLGEQTIFEHVCELNNDLKDIPEHEHEKYISKYKEFFSNWLRARTNCASSMIAGGANFNVARNEKANDRTHKAYEKFSNWRGKAKDAILKRQQEALPQEEKDAEKLESFKSMLESGCIGVHEASIGHSSASKTLLASNFYKRIDTYAKKGEVELIKEAILYVDDFQEYYNTTIFTKRHKFYKLVEMAESVKQKQEANQNRENKEMQIIGGILVWNWKENRLQFLFDKKPTPEVITSLKKNAFRWSHKNRAWQRQLTRNAEITAGIFLKEHGLIISKAS